MNTARPNAPRLRSNIQKKALQRSHSQSKELTSAITQKLEEIARVTGAQRVRLWRCPFHNAELISLLQVQNGATTRNTTQVLYGERTRPAGPELLHDLTRLETNDNSGTARWADPSRRKGQEESRFVAEVDIISDKRRIGVLCLEGEGNGFDSDEVSKANKETKQLRDELTSLLEDFESNAYIVRTLETLKHNFMDHLIQQEQNVISRRAAREPRPEDSKAHGSKHLLLLEFFEQVARSYRWLRRKDGEIPSDQDCHAALLYTISTGDGSRIATLSAADGQFLKLLQQADEQGPHRPLYSTLRTVNLRDDPKALLSKVYKKLQDSSSVVFPGGDQGHSVWSDLYRQIDSLADGKVAGSKDDSIAKFFKIVRESGSCGFFPVRWQGEIVAILAFFAGRRTFFNPINLHLSHTIAIQLGRMYGADREHIFEERELRDRKYGIIYRADPEHQLAEKIVGELDVQALVFFDLDRFKQLNDTHGHEAGDLAIRTIMTQLALEAIGVALDDADQFTELLDSYLANKRKRRELKFIPVHFGGDEFGLIFVKPKASIGQPDELRVSDQDRHIVEETKRILERAKKATRAALGELMSPERVQTSAGIALASHSQLPPPRATHALLKELRSTADDYMYLAKATSDIKIYCPGHTCREISLELGQKTPLGIWMATQSASRAGINQLSRVLAIGSEFTLNLQYELMRALHAEGATKIIPDLRLRALVKHLPQVRFVTTEVQENVVVLRQLDFPPEIQVASKMVIVSRTKIESS